MLDEQRKRLSCECDEHKSNAMSAEYREAELIKVLEAQSCEGKRMKYALDTLKLYAEADGEVTRNVVVDIVDEALAQIQEK